MSKILEMDASGGILAIEKMMRKQIAMPAKLIDKNIKDSNLYDRYSAITQKIGIYTTWDYADIIEHLVDFWKIENLKGLNAEAARGQEYLCTLSSRYKRIAERMKIPNEVRLAWLNKEENDIIV